MFNPIFKENVQGAETSRELFICRTKITYVKEAYSVDQKVINGHKNPSDSGSAGSAYEKPYSPSDPFHTYICFHVFMAQRNDNIVFWKMI